MKRKWIIISSIVLWSLLIILGVCIFIFRNNNDSPSTTERVNQEDQEELSNNYADCMKKASIIKTLPAQITLFWQNLKINNENCQEISGDSYEDTMKLFDMGYYFGNDISVVHKTILWSDSLDITQTNKRNLELGNLLTMGWDTSDVAYMFVKELPTAEKAWDYKIYLSIPSWDGPWSDWWFIITVLGKTGDFIYSIQNWFNIPVFSSLIAEASEYASYTMNKEEWDTSTLFNGKIPSSVAEKTIFDKLVQAIIFDNQTSENIEDQWDKQYTTMQYIASIIDQDKTYTNYINQKVKEMVTKYWLK